MNQNRIIFYGIFFLFHLGAYIFTVKIQDFTFLTKIYEHIGSFKYITLLGVFMVIADIVWSYVINHKHKKEKTALQNELNNLKAKLFDLQEDVKRLSQPPTPPDRK
jgi:hypothetical protein